MGREPEVLLAAAYPMAGVVGARNRVATRVLRAGPCTARPMGVVGAVSSLDAPRVQKDARISALLMVVAGDVATRVALELPEGSQDCVSGTVVARDARERTALRVQKDSQAFVSLMEVAVAARLSDARRGLKGAPCIARHMVAENGAQLQGAPKEPKGVLLSARATVGAKDVLSMAAGFVRRVCMGVPTSVWRTGEARGVPCQSAPKVPGEGPTTASAMVGGNGASLKDAARVRRAALIFARRTAEESDALGAILGQNLAPTLLVLATRLLGGKQVSVRSTAAWCRTRESTEVSPWAL